VNVCEITIGELISALRIPSVTFVHTEMPLRVFGESMHADELVFRIGRRFVLSPRAFFISDEMSFLDELRSERDGIFVELYAATRLRPGITDCVETNNQSDPPYAVKFANGYFHSRKPKCLPPPQKWQQYSLQRAVVQLGRTLEWGSRGRGFESRRPERIGSFRDLAVDQQEKLSIAEILTSA
jgi:hypothetical protein